MAFKADSQIKPFKKKAWLSSPTMHGEELKYMTEAFETNWMSTETYDCLVHSRLF